MFTPEQWAQHATEKREHAARLLGRAKDLRDGLAATADVATETEVWAYTRDAEILEREAAGHIEDADRAEFYASGGEDWAAEKRSRRQVA